MKAVLLDALGPLDQHPLRLADIGEPEPGPGQVLVRISACGVCRSNLHMVEGDWPGVPTFTPIVPGHELVGRVAALGEGVTAFAEGDRVGVQPLWSTCGRCEYCLTGRDPLCRTKEITGETVHGGYAEYTVSVADHTYLLPGGLDDAQAAPLFCPGITAYGAVAKVGLAPPRTMALFGVGGVGHMVLQLAALQGAQVTAVSRGREHLELATELGAVRGLDATAEDPGQVLASEGGVDASIVFAPSSTSLRQALQATKPGGTVVVGVNAEVGGLPFAEEKTIVGSLLGNRQQMREVLELAAAGRLRSVVETFPLEQAEEVLGRLKAGRVRARAVLLT